MEYNRIKTKEVTFRGYCGRWYQGHFYTKDGLMLLVNSEGKIVSILKTIGATKGLSIIPESIEEDER